MQEEKYEFKKVGEGDYEYRYDGKLLQLYVRGEEIHFEDGPEDGYARLHEAGGGTFLKSTVTKNKKDHYLYKYPGLWSELNKVL